VLITTSLGGIRAQEETRFEKAPNKNARLIALLFCRPELDIMRNDIIPSLPYFHRRSGGNTAFYFAGFENLERDLSIIGPENENWYFDPDSFNRFRRFRMEVEKETRWRHSGGCDMIMINSRRGRGHGLESAPTLDFTTAMVLRLDKIGEIVATPTVSQLFETVFRYAESQNDVDPTWGLSDRLGLKIAGSGVWDVIVGVLPESVRASVRAARHLVAQDIGVQGAA
jgi:hypothetical protein